MHLKFEDKDCIIHIKESLQHIKLIAVEDAVIHLEVPALLPQENLLFYIKNNLSKDIISWNAQKLYSTKYIDIFDKRVPVKIISGTQPYLQDNRVYCPSEYISSAKQIEALKMLLLLNLLNDKMSKIEEDLNILLPDLKLRKLKTNHFSICHTTYHITFSKDLVNQSTAMITYIVVWAINTFRRTNEEENRRMIMKYVPDWKHCEQVIAYERQQ